jgi:hypothetical protein
MRGMIRVGDLTPAQTFGRFMGEPPGYNEKVPVRHIPVLPEPKEQSRVGGI